jgi:hypothetical protein
MVVWFVFVGSGEHTINLISICVQVESTIDGWRGYPDGGSLVVKVVT